MASVIRPGMVWTFDGAQPRNARRLAFLILAAAMTFAVAAIGPSAAPASVGAARVVCGSFTGPAWKYSSLHKTGTLYQVSAEKTPCAFAKNWSARLARTAIHGKVPASLPGPAGWHCYLYGGIGALQYSKTTAANGRCDKGSAAFVWFPKLA